jgi:hypothetical protein
VPLTLGEKLLGRNRLKFASDVYATKLNLGRGIFSSTLLNSWTGAVQKVIPVKKKLIMKLSEKKIPKCFKNSTPSKSLSPDDMTFATSKIPKIFCTRKSNFGRDALFGRELDFAKKFTFYSRTTLYVPTGN